MDDQIRLWWNLQENFRQMQSSTMFNVGERKIFGRIYENLKNLAGGNATRQLFQSFYAACEANCGLVRMSGGLQSLHRVPDVANAWNPIWSVYGFVDGDESRILRSYVVFMASKAPVSGDRLRPTATVSKLIDQENWRRGIDRKLLQRYEMQSGFMVTHVKSLLQTLQNPLKMDVIRCLESIAPNIPDKGFYTLHIKREFYRICLAIDIKAKLYHDALAAGDDFSSILEAALISDTDLKDVVIGLLRAMHNQSDFHDQVFALLFELIIEGCLNSILKFCYESAGVTCSSSSVYQVPLRMSLMPKKAVPKKSASKKSKSR